METHRRLTPSQKSLDQKLARILADPACRDFILADAKDADMAFGLAARAAARSITPARPASARSTSTAS